MLQITSDLVASKSISINKSSVERVDTDKMIVKANVVGKKSKIELFTTKAKLIFVK